jgi:O-antigen ligase
MAAATASKENSAPQGFWLLLGRGWRAIILTCFLLLCVRFQLRAIFDAPPDIWPTATLALGAGACGYCFQLTAVFAFLIAIPALGILPVIGLLDCASPPSLVFSALFLGLTLRQSGSLCRRPAAGVCPISPFRAALLATDIIISIILLSLALELARKFGLNGLSQLARSTPERAFGSDLYFIASAFLWLEGLFLFRILCGAGRSFSGQIKSILMASVGLVTFFFALQFWADVPGPYRIPPSTLVRFSPYEDIHAFGSVAVALLAYVLGSWPRLSPVPARHFRLGLRVLAALLLLFFVVQSWSRATWLAGGVALMLFGLLRMPFRWVVALIAAGFLVVVCFNFAPRAALSSRNAYLLRLSSLVRIESLAHKDPARGFLYEKGLAMIRRRPFAGFGIGSFYSSSPAFADPADPYAQTPNFAHNLFLQFAAELGLPAALVLAGLLGFVLGRGFLAAREGGRLGQPGSAALSVAGLVIALAAYLVTQLSANAPNIYITQQFFLWFIAAATLVEAIRAVQPSQEPNLPPAGEV